MDGDRLAAGPMLVSYHGVTVPPAPHLSAGMLLAIQEGRYERPEIDAALACVPNGARILEMGSGAGVVGATIARNKAPSAMLSIEANPELIPHIQALYAANGLSKVIELRHAVVLAAPETPETVEFHVRGNFLGSALDKPAQKRARPYQVPVLPYAKLKAEFPHDVIVMDIEGAELDFLTHADLSGVSLVIGEFHRRAFGQEGMRSCRRRLRRQGFQMVPEASSLAVHVWRRDG